METTCYLIIIVFLLVLAVVDLFVGVSNDAVNFMNSAIGAKAAVLHHEDVVMLVAKSDEQPRYALGV
ncbi:MAG: hypothetical protein IJU33_11285, partial [Bacteroidales bacterium]|nr:hypothetical protein [Bacteroidales bacterium]